MNMKNQIIMMRNKLKFLELGFLILHFFLNLSFSLQIKAYGQGHANENNLDKIEEEFLAFQKRMIDEQHTPLDLHRSLERWLGVNNPRDIDKDPVMLKKIVEWDEKQQRLHQ